MSITVRLWSKEDLAKIGKDAKLTTIFMNRGTFSAEEIKHYPYHLRREYSIMLGSMDPEDEPIRVYATSDAMAKWFVGQEYNGIIESMTEIVTKQRPINIGAKRVAKPKSKAKSRRKSSSGGVSLSGMR